MSDEAAAAHSSMRAAEAQVVQMVSKQREAEAEVLLSLSDPDGFFRKVDADG